MVDSESKPLVWLSGEVKTPPFSTDARIQAGFLLRKLQDGESLSMPFSRPMPSIGAHCHEIRLADSQASKDWRIIYRIDVDAIIIVDVFNKTTNKTPDSIIEKCKKRLKQYDEI
ncbi:type II toxin-antitoxin system RelE/ParE family toxin [Microcoleus sp. F10-C6]|uniref:Transposase n=1 Tax=Phormidium nigroviride PCC 7112 TaxID=179408 RepID=K9VQJ7_9CYAN|nr:type II toxin-antitoxin system RelE/ParE family toxin [Oscillatoria nigro-viridis]AFZ10363.1 transposase [Oscillatoria nigro-viridis PCC 7112]